MGFPRGGRGRPMVPVTDADVISNVQRVREQIARACNRAGREEEAVKLVAVTKTVEAELIVKALRAGVTCLGENRVQEGIAKRLELAEELFEYHLVGPLQKNKVNKAVDCFDWIETIDSIELAQRIDRACSVRGKSMQALIQVNLAKEPGKSGIEVENLNELAEQTQSLGNLAVRGLMAIPPYFERPEDVRPFFRRLREHLEQLKMQLHSHVFFSELSMGMSHDFPVAIEEGATIVRIGTAIFGERVYT